MVTARQESYLNFFTMNTLICISAKKSTNIFKLIAPQGLGQMVIVLGILQRK